MFPGAHFRYKHDLATFLSSSLVIMVGYTTEYRPQSAFSGRSGTPLRRLNARSPTRALTPTRLFFRHRFFSPIQVDPSTTQKAIHDIEFYSQTKGINKLPKEKYVLPQTESQEIGWMTEQFVKAHPRNHFPRQLHDVTTYADAYVDMTGRSPFASVYNKAE